MSTQPLLKFVRSNKSGVTTLAIAQHLGLGPDAARKRCKNAGLQANKSAKGILWTAPEAKTAKGEIYDYPVATGLNKQVATDMIAALESSWGIKAYLWSGEVRVPHHQKRLGRALANAFLLGRRSARG